MEDRWHKRTQIRIGCWIIGMDGVSSCCSSFDISDNGISISTAEPLPVGQEVCLQFYTPLSASALTVSAEVVWTRSTPESAMGLRFLDISRQEVELLREMIRQVSTNEKNARKSHNQP